MPDAVLAGVGGQGTVLSTRVLAEAALLSGYDVKTSEVHGMAQRGGSVVSAVRWGEKVYSPLVPSGSADFLLAFEMLEGLRELGSLSPRGIAIVNPYRMDPLPVLRGDAVYPEDALERISERAGRTMIVPARELAMEAGSARALGSCLLGALSIFLDFPREAWRQAIERYCPQRFVEVNLKAFELGREYAGRS
jgi:indolepyruvate ferredoxin oxidoreductase beta subunit